MMEPNPNAYTHKARFAAFEGATQLREGSALRGERRWPLRGRRWVARSSGAAAQRTRSLCVGEGGMMDPNPNAYTHKARFAAFEGATQLREGRPHTDPHRASPVCGRQAPHTLPHCLYAANG